MELIFTAAIIIVLLLQLQSDETDVSQFDTRFTRQTPVDSPDDSALSESANRVFAVCTNLIDFTRHVTAIMLATQTHQF